MRRVALVMALAIASVPAHTQAPPLVLPDLRDTYVPAPPADDTLYRALGGEAGVRALAQDFLAALRSDPRVGTVFGQADAARFQAQIALELCFVSGGPCTRQRNVRKVHAEMDINKASFNAVVEVLQRTLQARGVPFAVQNRLLAQLAPMHRDIISPD